MAAAAPDTRWVVTTLRRGREKLHYLNAAPINDLAERYDLPGTYAAICFVILVSVCFFVLTERIERWLRPVN